MGAITLLVIVLALVSCTYAATEKLFMNQLRVPDGFKVQVYARNIPYARSMSLGQSGVLYVASYNFKGISGAHKDLTRVYAAMDDNGDGYAESIFNVTEPMWVPNGIVSYDGSLYIAQVDRVMKVSGVDATYRKGPRAADKMILGPDTLPNRTWHGWRYARAHEGKLYVAVGAPCNVPGNDDVDCITGHPYFASIIRSNLDGTEVEVVARGLRNSVGITFHPRTGDMWFTDNGRDNWEPDHSSRPPDELNRLDLANLGAHYGFPACYGKDLVDAPFNPEGNCNKYVGASVELDSHAAALGLRVYYGQQFPADYEGNIFIAEHGSWNRQPPAGYRVTRVKVSANGTILGSTPFLTGFIDNSKTCNTDADCPGTSQCQNKNGTGRPYVFPFYCSGWGRPSDIEVLPDGSVLVSDEQNGVVYRISYDEAELWYKNGPLMIAIFCLAIVPFVFIYLWANRPSNKPKIIEPKAAKADHHDDHGQLNSVLGFVRTEAKRIDENDPLLTTSSSPSPARLTEKRGTSAPASPAPPAAAAREDVRTPLLAAAAPVSSTHGTLQSS